MFADLRHAWRELRRAPGYRPAAVAIDGSRPAAPAIPVGRAGAVAAGGLVRRLLYGLGAVEPIVLAGVPVLLGAVTLAAGALPARRAARVSPLVAMQAE